MKVKFEIKSYHIDIYHKGKYFGYIVRNNPDREIMGYSGRIKKVLKNDFIFKNKKIKAGSVVITECVPICGKLIGTMKDKIKMLSNSRVIYNY